MPNWTPSLKPLAAAELTERVCYSIELDAKYVDVAVKRWESLTDKKATLEGSCGQTFEHVRDGRRMEAEDSIKEDALRLIEERA